MTHLGASKTSCMPYTDLRPYHGRYGCHTAVPTIRWLPLLTVSDRWLAAPKTAPRARCSARPSLVLILGGAAKAELTEQVERRECLDATIMSARR